jgi:hypothetical protein
MRVLRSTELMINPPAVAAFSHSPGSNAACGIHGVHSKTSDRADGIFAVGFSASDLQSSQCHQGICVDVKQAIDELLSPAVILMFASCGVQRPDTCVRGNELGVGGLSTIAPARIVGPVTERCPCSRLPLQRNLAPRSPASVTLPQADGLGLCHCRLTQCITQKC